MNKIIFILALFLTFLAYKFVEGDTSYSNYKNLDKQISELKEENKRLKENISIKKAKIKNLKEGISVIEEKARYELGLIKEKETFYQIIK
jgi:cell division protein FtsB